MITTNRTQEEKNINRIILLASTFIIFVLSLIVAYIFIGLEIEEFKKHLKTFESTLVQREKLSIKTMTDNLINDMRDERSNEEEEMRRRVKDRTVIIYDLIQSILAQNTLKGRDEIMHMILKSIRAITVGSDLDFYIFDADGTLIFNSSDGIGEGKNFIDFKDINGEEFVRSIVQKNGFVEYAWFVPNESIVSRKITYSKKMNVLDVVIGSGAFLDKQYSVKQNLYTRIKREKLNENEFIFVYEIMSLNHILKSARLVAQKHILVDAKTLQAVKEILMESDYAGAAYHKYDNKIFYAKFLPEEKIFIASGVDLNAISGILERDRKRSRENLKAKIGSLGINILIIALIFFILSYAMSKKIEKIFKNYRIKAADSQQLLIQKSKMAAMGEMIGNITHQWRQPLSQISGLFHDIESAYDYGELDKKYLSTRVDEANDLLEYMSETMEEFRVFFGPDADSEIFSVNDGVEKALMIIGASLKIHHIEIKLHIDKGIHINGFLNAFSQVILNILSNVKEIALSRGIRYPSIDIGSRVEAGFVYLTIEDNCGGIDEEIMGTVFEPYVTTKYAYGTGIGLYMSKLIIENKMQGEISVENNESGAVFMLKMSVA